VHPRPSLSRGPGRLVLGVLGVLGVLAGVAVVACQPAPSGDGSAVVPGGGAPADGVPPVPAGRAGGSAGSGDEVTIALGGDVHFEGGLVDVPSTPGSTLGPVSRVLREADVAVVNLESAVARAGVGRPARKENEDPSARYWFRSPPEALDVLARSGVDAVSLANNHGADHGVAGLRDTLRAEAGSTVDVIGVGADDVAAFTPYRTTVRGTRVAVLAADATLRESADPVWAARPGSGPGLATARLPHVRPMLAAVRAAAAADDVVVVYLHWGAEYDACPTSDQRDLARALADAGADVVVGTHAHVLLGAGMLDDTYVSYGLGGLYWYHGIRPETGVLRLTVDGGRVVRDEWVPGEIPPAGGGPRMLAGAERRAAAAEWRALRACTDLEPGPGASDPAPAPAPDPGEGQPATLPAYTSTVRRVGPALAARMTGSSHEPASCPVPLSDLRLLELTHVGFDGRAHRGRIVVHADVAGDVVEAFGGVLPGAVPDPADAAGRRLRGRRRPLDGGQQHLGLQLPHRRRAEHLLAARLRPRRRHQPGAEPVRPR
jgi:poly-gamma-glutamate capsule biosynthesis protein CapA/YwtB (metallophosphatase superfamily)